MRRQGYQPLPLPSPAIPVARIGISHSEMFIIAENGMWLWSSIGRRWIRVAEQR